MDKHTAQIRSTQTEVFIRLFESRPVMTSLELQRACLEVGILNSTARKSDAEKQGHEWEVTRMEGSTQFRFKYLGKREPGQMKLFEAA